MRTPNVLTIIAAASAIISVATAQTPPVSAPTGQKTLAATLNVYAFPSAGQAPNQQATDETTCYNWAVQNTGNDPFQVAKNTQAAQQQAAQHQQQVQQSTAGAGAKGAVGGAAAGALIGAIAGNAGKGAAIGAGAGLLAGKASQSQQQQQASQQAKQQVQAANQTQAQQLDAFRKAFSVCLESHQYMVRY
jgi:outer membrane protein with glycine zipper